jgi:hypothetical protein
MEVSYFFEPKEKRIKVRCMECLHIHQEDKTKEMFFCLKARDFVEHKLDKKIKCESFEAQI